jgi:uncharacterized protein YbjQ (UPF0145 family)
LGRNVELENFTSAMYEAREIAIERMRYEAVAAKAEAWWASTFTRAATAGRPT